MMWFSKEKKNDRKKTLNMIFFYESQRCKKKNPQKQTYITSRHIFGSKIYVKNAT